MTQTILKDLGGGLILRRATPADTDALAKFNATVHSDDGPDKRDERIGAWVRDLMTQPHPTTSAADFIIVEDTQTKKIVSSMNLIPQTWSYAGIEFGVGRPELVGTDPEYRRRGLVREQFDVIHQWSAARGHKLQIITGIPYYYRQFGYEMGLALDGGRVGYIPHIPKLKDDEEEAYCLRPAEARDIAFITELYSARAQRQLLHCERNEDTMQYELFGKSEKNVNRIETRIIENQAGEAAGYLMHPPFLWGPTLTVREFELVAGLSWLAIAPSVLRYLKTTGEAYAAEKEEQEFQAFAMWMGVEHPIYEAISDLLPRVRDPYAYYVRVADLPDFLLHIAPALEARLAKSVLAGHSGELKLNFFKNGVKLTFEQGQIKAVESYAPEKTEDGDALFPDLTFLRVLFGYNSFWDIEKLFADCYVRNNAARALVPILFPKQASNVWGLA
ncbi:MAG: GNAT family N-acetyltransferase [Chloroflexi bacterium]|nr:GNAT family N-acetyltransferase [Chloroflexota bacterium]